MSCAIMWGMHSGVNYGESEVMRGGSGQHQGFYKRITGFRSVVCLGLSMWANYRLRKSIQELLLRKIHHVAFVPRVDQIKTTLGVKRNTQQRKWQF